jgi:hypothetical protein
MPCRTRRSALGGSVTQAAIVFLHLSSPDRPLHCCFCAGAAFGQITVGTTTPRRSSLRRTCNSMMDRREALLLVDRLKRRTRDPDVLTLCELSMGQMSTGQSRGSGGRMTTGHRRLFFRSTSCPVCAACRAAETARKKDGAMGAETDADVRAARGRARARLVKVMTEGKSEAARVAAATALLDCGCGRPKHASPPAPPGSSFEPVAPVRSPARGKLNMTAASTRFGSWWAYSHRSR